ncbi:hypothetical protein BDA99DRAFT_513615 [Phascolomyces articulosus]|uniref:Uncharacterized protein n=1 Tax=Phascolomyces articulosus TaxID=60185 RepID=A0AAD5JXW4_9FUNG|nr:hypothetical protein BDA99DRAFT_513615 [Phascolomyces articulosus]
MEVSTPLTATTIEPTTNTLYPMAGIQEWELERAMALSQLQQHRERANNLEQKIEEDKRLYDKHRMSLINEIKLKEVLNEKRIQNMEKHYLEHIQILHKQLDQERQERKIEAKDIHQRYESMIQNEQKKHERRICSFQQRLSAKDYEYAKLQKDIRLTQSPPISPRTPDTPIHSDCDSVATDESNSTLTLISSSTNTTPVRLLQEKVFKLQVHQDELEKNHQIELEKQKLVFDKECSYLQQKIQDLESLLKEQQEPQQQQWLERLQKEYQKGAQKVYQERLQQIEQTFNEKHKLTMESYRGDLAQMKERFIHETQQLTMHQEAHCQNLVSEHEHTLTEMKEQHDNEMEVLRIEHQAALADLEFYMKREKQDALYDCEQTWKTKLQDVRTAMSDDAIKVQKYWDNRIEEAASARETEFTHLVGELEVVKDRLGREIEKCQDMTRQLNKAAQDVQLHKKTKAIATQECLKLQRMQRRAYTLAVTVASVSQPQHNTMNEINEVDETIDISSNLSLFDLLQRSISQITRLQAQNSMMEKVRSLLYK